MAITLAEASVGRADKVSKEVIDELRRGSVFMDKLIFDDCISPGSAGSTLTYGYQQIQTPSTAAGRAINSEYAADEAKRVKKTVDLKIFGGASEVDRVIQEASGNSEIAFQIHQKTLAVRNHIQYTVINGSKTNNTLDFDGLSSLLTGKSTECNVGADKVIIDLSTSAQMDANYKSAQDMVDEFLATLDGKADLILGNSKAIAKLRGVARRAGFHSLSEDAFGKPVDGYDNIPFYDMGNYAYKSGNSVLTKPCVPIYTSGSGNDAVTGLTDIYAVKLGLDAFHGVSLSGSSIIKAILPDLDSPGAVKKAEVEAVMAVVLKNTTKCAVLRNIKIA